MSNKNKIIITMVLILVIIIGFVFIKNKSNNKQNAKENINVDYDNETGLYYVRNEATGEIISASQNKEDLQFYIDNPDYNPNPLAPKKTDINEFVNMENSDVNY